MTGLTVCRKCKKLLPFEMCDDQPTIRPHECELCVRDRLVRRLFIVALLVLLVVAACAVHRIAIVAHNTTESVMVGK